MLLLTFSLKTQFSFIYLHLGTDIKLEKELERAWEGHLASYNFLLLKMTLKLSISNQKSPSKLPRPPIPYEVTRGKNFLLEPYDSLL